MDFRIGFGMDVHPLAEGENLWLGGVLIPYEKGTVAHSDGDVLIHAICDALLGAVKMGDIGTIFPDTSDEFRNIDSKILLYRTYQLVKMKKYHLVNIDSTICAQEPKLRPFIHDMETTLSGVMEIDPEQISIKATTTEKLGFVGRGEGISAFAMVLIQQSV